MSSEMLLMAVLVAMTCVAVMIAINSRGRWRATLSSLMAVCMLGGTIWIFTLQYNLADAFEAPADRSDRRRGGTEQPEALRPVAATDPSKHERAGRAAMARSLIEEAAQFADALARERMHDPLLSHDQLIARADGVAQRYDALKSEMDRSAQLLERFPEAARLSDGAMNDLKAASHFYRAYYFAENTEAETSAERLMKQRAKNAHDTLIRATKAVKDSGG